MAVLNPAKTRFASAARRPAPLSETDAPEASFVRMKLNGSRRWRNPQGSRPAASVTNYLIGNDRSKWHTNVASYTELKELGVYDGIDMAFYSRRGDLEYDFLVAPRADPGQIHLAFDGIDRMRVDEQSGDLCLTLTSGREMKQLRPRIYQQIGEQQVEVSGNYQILDRQEVTFALASYDRSRALVIDPGVSFTTVFKGELLDWSQGIALDASGNAYFAGYTSSLTFPVITRIPSIGLGHPHGGVDAFVDKVSKTGAILFSTYLGASKDDRVFGVAVDATGLYVTGTTSSPDFPMLYTPVQIQGRLRSQADQCRPRVFQDSGQLVRRCCDCGGPFPICLHPWSDRQPVFSGCRASPISL